MTQEKNNLSGNHNNSNHSFVDEALKHVSFDKRTLGQRAADRITAIVGSWKFLIFQSVLLSIWVVVNVIAWVNHWDPYPFILLNLILSFQAAYTAPIILMSQNRTAEKDRKKMEIDLATDRKAEREIKEIQEQLSKIEKEKLDKILKILEGGK